jgi:RNA polymerase sigma-70 factor (ECF subfamily)
MSEFDQIPSRQGHTRAAEALVRSYYGDVWRVCSLLVDRDTADDLTQETFARALCALAGYRGEATTRTWVLSIARNVCADELRRRTRQRRRDNDLTAAAGISLSAVPDPETAATLSLLGELNPDRRAAFVLTQLFRLPYHETATICKCPPGTIRSRVARARAQLIELIEQGQVVSANETTGRYPHVAAGTPSPGSQHHHRRRPAAKLITGGATALKSSASRPDIPPV